MGIDQLFIHTIEYRPYLGAGSLGDTYGDPVTTPALIDPGEVLYRTPEGREKTARATVYLPIDLEPAPSLQSEVTGRAPGLHGHIADIAEWRDDTGILPECWQVVIDS